MSEIYSHIHTHHQQRRQGAIWGNESSIAVYVTNEFAAPRFWLAVDEVEYLWSHPLFDEEGNQVGLSKSPRVRAGIAFPNSISATAFINRLIDFKFGDNDDQLRGRVSRFLSEFGSQTSTPETLITAFGSDV